MKNPLMAIATIVVIILVGVGIYMFGPWSGNEVKMTNDTENNASTTPQNNEEDKKEGEQVVIGKSVEGRDIVAYNYGTGETRLLLIGGVHGGYSWNTALLGQQIVDYVKSHPEMIPEDITVTIIPVLNPDGLEDAVGTAGNFTAGDVSASQSVLVASRLNANDVDLSRNFDCNWKSNAVWQNKPVSGGTQVFSEPEARAIRDYIESHEVKASVVWYSAAGGVYASQCGDDTMFDTTTLTNLFAEASGYPAHESYDYYATTGDLVNWLAKKQIPAISVLLTNHTDTELSKNIKGIEAVIEQYSKK